MSNPNSKEALAAAVKYFKADHWLGIWLEDSEGRVNIRRGILARQVGLDLIRWGDGSLEERYIERNAESVIAAANAGDQIAHEALCRAALHLTKHGKILPPQLQRYVVAAASELKRGRPGKRLRVFNDLRDGAIFHALEIVMTFGFNATRNNAHRDGVESACSIVAQALGKCGAALSESQVKKIMEAQLKGWKRADVMLMPVWEDYLKKRTSDRPTTTRPKGALRSRLAP
jgi:hypothetical protein